jgi:hypothetical protein
MLGGTDAARDAKIPISKHTYNKIPIPREDAQKMESRERNHTDVSIDKHANTRIGQK